MSLRTFYTTLGLLALVVFWTYWTTFTKAADRWMSDIQYSHGWIIPLFSLYLLHHRQGMLANRKLEPSWWCLPFLALALLLRWAEVYFYWNALDPLSLIPMLMGLMLAVGGWPAFRWSWPAIGFLIFMVPLPYFLHIGMSTQLQQAATVMSTFMLQTFGFPAVSEGTLIKINEAPINVAEACSGLGMVVTFVALSVAAVLLISSTWWVKAGLLLGAIPLSLICNTVRISIVGAFKYWGYSPETVDDIHTASGWLMILLGCVLIFVELYILERIVIARDLSRDNDIPLQLPYGSPVPGTSAS